MVGIKVLLRSPTNSSNHVDVFKSSPETSGKSPSRARATERIFSGTRALSQVSQGEREIAAHNKMLGQYDSELRHSNPIVFSHAAVDSEQVASSNCSYAQEKNDPRVLSLSLSLLQITNQIYRYHIVFCWLQL